MKITYRREMKHNYLIIEPDEAGYDSYEMYMMAANGIEGLLKFRIKLVDNRKYYYYEITSKQPLNRVLEFHSLGQEELKKLIGGIAQTLGRLEIYLLQEKQILLEPEYIYVEPERFTVFLCLVPGRQGGFPEEMTGLLRYLLGKINHQDKECVVMAYGLYQESLKENYGVNDLLEVIGKNSANTEKNDDKTRKLEDDRELEGSHAADMPYPFRKEMDEKGPDPVWDEKKKVSELSCIGRMALTSISILFGASAVLWLSFGMGGIRKFWYVIAAAGVLSVFAVRIGSGKGSRLQKEPIQIHKKEECHEWQMTFEDGINEKEPEAEEEEILQTVLLTDTAEDKNIRYLRAVGPDMEDIAITYVPFLIGKQEGLVDYVLDREAISRIHARIDREGEEYRVSDLNSTNGTTVNGRILETNETVALKKGDEVFIANFAFIFT
ncbi:DUF6382 domain-containing protein [Clostridium sp. Marseille-P2415]|uniref:DUF6382 domain-containing protein n=1 Tax=Clostridium sp. Marseille-P2415 TaxID=1805471 RepID=UPI0009885527|nr:DUF6382 domain-containing protein [Clostridium sp. Marseille-P2415]